MIISSTFDFQNEGQITFHNAVIDFFERYGLGQDVLKKKGLKRGDHEDTIDFFIDNRICIYRCWAGKMEKRKETDALSHLLCLG